MKTKKLLCLLICLILLMVVVVGCGNDSDNLDTEAKVYAEQAVEKMLKAPSTAKFSGWGDTKITKVNENTYNIKGYVDAENSFGAKLRKNYSVDVVFSGKTYRVENLVLK